MYMLKEILETFDSYVPIRPIAKFIGSCVERIVEPKLVRYEALKQAELEKELLMKYPFKCISILNKYAEDNKVIIPKASIESFSNALKIAQFAQSFMVADSLKDKDDFDCFNDKEWFNRFIDNSTYVSDEELQILWGRLLAEKILRPDNVNKRVLRFLCDLDKSELEIIQTYMSYFKYEYLPQSIAYNNNELLNQILRLLDLGLVTQYPTLDRKYIIEFIIRLSPDNNSIDFSDCKIVVLKLDKEVDVRFVAYYLTNEGKVLNKILDQQAPAEVIDTFLSEIKRSLGEGYELEVIRE